MKNRRAKALGSARAESYSPEFEALFKEHWPRVYRHLCRLVGDPAEAEDLALETFFRLYRYRPTSQDEFNTSGWLHKVATNLGLQSIRSFKRRERYEMAAGKSVLDERPENRPAEIQAQEEERQLVRLTLSRMNPRQARLLVLRYSGLAYKDIAEALGLSPSSIGPMLLRAEREFEKCFKMLVQEEV